MKDRKAIYKLKVVESINDTWKSETCAASYVKAEQGEHRGIISGAAGKPQNLFRISGWALSCAVNFIFPLYVQEN